MVIEIVFAVTLCSDAPHGGGKWFYRVVDGHRCWFQAEGIRRGREKPREELRWPRYDAEFEGRWNGEVEDRRGWSHGE
jgi:hypothetical protein